MKTKKLIALLLVLLLTLSMGTTAFADGDDGSITIRNATVGETYVIYKVFDLTYSGDNVSYTYTKTGTTDTLFDALTAEGSPFTLTDTSTAGVYSVTSTADADTIAAWFSEKVSLLTETDNTEATTSEVKFSGIPYGYYYITSSLGTVVTVDSAKKDVTVIDKNQGHSWKDNGKAIVLDDGSKVVENTVNYGDTVNFSITVNATAYDGTDLVTYYHITDTLGDGFSPADADTIKVKVGTKELAATEYKLDQTGNTFEVTIPFGEIYGSNAVIEVTYSATVLSTDAVVLAGDGNPNTANYSVDKTPFNPNDPPFNPEDPSDPDYPESEDPAYPKENEKTTSTYVYAIGVLKVDADGNKLSGAKFSVLDDDGNLFPATGSDGVYVYDPLGEETVLETNSDGLLVVKGFQAGRYSIKEVVAPNGYNILEEPVSVTATLKEKYSTKVTIYYDEDGNITNEVTENTAEEVDAGVNVTGLFVVNNAGTVLPSTGGIGTTIFYVLGSIMLMGAGVFFVTKKRMESSAE